MARVESMTSSLYCGSCVILATKHSKGIAVAPAFLEKLGANVVEYLVDTDQLGTFSGEIERKGNALECARKKCELSLTQLGNKVEFALASEGSFGPHPSMPFMPCDQEILYFIDKKHGFHLHLSYLSEETNYNMQTVESFEELHKFAVDALFPSHALILRPSSREAKSLLFKGIQSWFDLEESFEKSSNASSDKKVWVETDMRAHVNPTRMSVISELSHKLGEQLQTLCPKCENPGWGKIKQEKGLPCSWCGSPTQLFKSEIYGCVKCGYQEITARSDGLLEADPANCQYCNP